MSELKVQPVPSAPVSVEPRSTGRTAAVESVPKRARVEPPEAAEAETGFGERLLGRAQAPAEALSRRERVLGKEWVEDAELRSMPRQPNERRRRRAGSTAGRVGTSWGSLVWMALAVLGLTFSAWLYVTDAPEPEDKDLRLAAGPELPGSIQAPTRLQVFLASLSPLPTPEWKTQAPWLWSAEGTAQWLAANSQALDNLKDLLEEADWHGRHASWHLTDLGAHPNWMTVALLKQAEAAHLMRQGQEEAAFAAALDLAELARRLQDIQAWPSFYFRSQEIHLRAVQSLAALLEATRLSADALAPFQEQFAACAPLDQHLRQNVLPGFYWFEKKVLLGQASGEPVSLMPGGQPRARPKQLFFKTQETLGLLAGTMRFLVAQIGQTSVSSGDIRETWRGVPGTRGLALYAPNGRGAVYAGERVESYLQVPAMHQLARTRHLLVELLFAMRRFVAQEHGLPQTLSALTPRFLERMPLDPYSGESFLYDPLQGVIHSVGNDVMTQGSRAEPPSLVDPTEPAVRIGVKKATAIR
jgi:hypothetical protein